MQFQTVKALDEITWKSDGYKDDKNGDHVGAIVDFGDGTNARFGGTIHDKGGYSIGATVEDNGVLGSVGYDNRGGGTFGVGVGFRW